MAQMMRLVDDVDKESDADRTISFAFAGKEYEIDLSQENVDQFTDEMAFWIQFSRKRGTVPKVLSARQLAEASAQDDMDNDDEWWRTPDGASYAEQKRFNALRQEIREWGAHNGYPSLGERGKLPRALYAKWRKAHQDTYRHRKQDPDAEDDESETDTDPGQGELAMAPSFSDGRKPTRKPSAKKTASRTRAAAIVRAAS